MKIIDYKLRKYNNESHIYYDEYWLYNQLLENNGKYPKYKTTALWSRAYHNLIRDNIIKWDVATNMIYFV